MLSSCRRFWFKPKQPTFGHACALRTLFKLKQKSHCFCQHEKYYTRLILAFLVAGTAGPVKEGKVAREHCLLKSERPPQVTLLALTRDAVARLPQGRGTRSLVCSLVKDSQYLAPLVTEAQVGTNRSVNLQIQEQILVVAVNLYFRP